MPMKLPTDLGDNQCVIVTVGLDCAKIVQVKIEILPYVLENFILIEANGNTDWMVTESKCQHGWGPFLYDLAMELAGHANLWLRSHSNSVSDDALKLWERYLSRNDVERKKLISQVSPYDPTEATKYMYRKLQMNLVSELKRMGKMENVIYRPQPQFGNDYAQF